MTKAKRRVSKKTGIPLSRGGRLIKVGMFKMLIVSVRQVKNPLGSVGTNTSEEFEEFKIDD